MGQHKTYERGPRWYALLLGFSVGILLVAGALYGMAHNSGGLMGARGLGKVLGFGLLLMAAPVWAYFRKRKHRSRT